MDDFNIETLREEFDTTVYNVSTVSAAQEKLRQTVVDCVVTEYSLAETTGIDLVRRIHDTSTTLPVIWDSRRQRTTRQ